jgi:hypothetical protein
MSMRITTLFSLSFAVEFVFSLASLGGGNLPSASVWADEPVKTPKPVILPELDRCTLTFDGRTLKAARTQIPWQQENSAGDLRIVLLGRNVHGIAADGKPKWTTEAPDGRSLYWLAGDREIAYLGGYQVDGKTNEEKLDSPPQVRRLDLATGKWLVSLPVAEKQAADAKLLENILSVLPGDKNVVVLSTNIHNDGSPKNGQLASYRVTCFPQKETKARWAKSFRSAGSKARDGAFLLAASRWPNKASSHVRHLSWLGDAVLVCAGDVQHILCLDRETGKGRWWVERIWQKERGFIGPSVWQHILGDTHKGSPEDGDKNKKEAGLERFFQGVTEEGYRGAVIGGPVVVPVASAGGKEKTYHIFVAASRTRAVQYADYLAQGVVYELDEQGAFLSTANLPRLVQGGKVHVLPDGVVWACQENALVKLALSRRTFHFGGPGGPDLITRVAWYRQLAPGEPSAWLQSDRAGDPIAFAGSWAFRLPAGGYVLNQKKPIYDFPITLFDLRTGQDRTMTLHVPFQGKLPKPESNFAETELPSGKSSLRITGPFILCITQMGVEGRSLRVTLGMENWSAVVDFDVGELLNSKGKSEQR